MLLTSDSDADVTDDDDVDAAGFWYWWCWCCDKSLHRVFHICLLSTDAEPAGTVTDHAAYLVTLSSSVDPDVADDDDTDAAAPAPKK